MYHYKQKLNYDMMEVRLMYSSVLVSCYWYKYDRAYIHRSTDWVLYPGPRA